VHVESEIRATASEGLGDVCPPSAAQISNSACSDIQVAGELRLTMIFIMVRMTAAAATMILMV
jgi:hypothetical protein